MGVLEEYTYNPLTLISYVRGKKISLQPVSQAAEPPALIVFVQDADDVTTAYGELVRTVSVVVVECNDLEYRTNEVGRHKHVSEYAVSDRVHCQSKDSPVAEQRWHLSPDGRLRKGAQKVSDMTR